MSGTRRGRAPLPTALGASLGGDADGRAPPCTRRAMLDARSASELALGVDEGAAAPPPDPVPETLASPSGKHPAADAASAKRTHHLATRISGSLNKVISPDARVADPEPVEVLPLFQLCGRDGNLSHLRSMLLQQEGGADAVNELNGRGDSALHVAAKWSNMEACVALLEAGASVTVRDKNFDIPSSESFHKGAALFIKKKADWIDTKSSKDSGKTPVYYMNMNRILVPCLNDLFPCTRAHVVRSLMAEVEARHHEPALIWAANAGHVHLVTYILDAPWFNSPLLQGEVQAAATPGLARIIPPIDVSDRFGKTAVFRACATGRSRDIVHILCIKRACLAVSDQDGRTPLHAAASRGDAAICKTLIEYFANVGATSKTGRSPLHEAAAAGHEAVCALLIQRGANLFAKTMEFRDILPQLAMTPAEIAKQHKKFDLAKKLEVLDGW